MASVSVGGNAKFYMTVHYPKIALNLFDLNLPTFSYSEASILHLIWFIMVQRSVAKSKINIRSITKLVQELSIVLINKCLF